MKSPYVLAIKSIDGNWCDKDLVLLHACFQILSNCIEEEGLLTGHIDWEADDLHSNAKTEINELYSWWLMRKILGKVDAVADLNKDQYLEDDKMLIRLINVRQFLWT